LFNSVLALALIATLASIAGAQPAADPAGALERMSAAAESSLRQGELQIAESTYRSALMSGWMLIGTLRTDERRLSDARDAFQRAASSAVDARAALQSLALVHLQMGEAGRAVTILTRLAGANIKDPQIHRLLAQALVANGQGEEAVQEMEEARAAAPDDPELAFMLASGYLRVKKLDAAERLFAEVGKARPAPQPTYSSAALTAMPDATIALVPRSRRP